MVVDLDRPALAAIAHYRHLAEMLGQVVLRNCAIAPARVLDIKALPVSRCLPLEPL
jgi:hypothetical protein